MLLKFISFRFPWSALINFQTYTDACISPSSYIPFWGRTYPHHSKVINPLRILQKISHFRFLFIESIQTFRKGKSLRWSRIVWSNLDHSRTLRNRKSLEWPEPTGILYNILENSKIIYNLFELSGRFYNIL